MKLFLFSLLLPLLAQAENFTFPADSGVADVTKAPYNADSTGKTDSTLAIQKALDDKRSLIYFSNGTYLVTDTLRWGKGDGKGSAWKRQIFQGESEAGVIIRLADQCATAGDAAQPKPVIWTGHAPAQRFRNGIRNLTIDTGSGNPGAIGAQFIANNQGGMRDVTIRSGDGAGVIGLDLGFSDEQGPCLIKNVTVRGFDIGISTKHAVDSVTLENIRIEKQRVVGFLNNGQCVSLRGFHSVNDVPALKNVAGPGLVALFDAELKTTTANNGPAIFNESGMFARNVATSGYKIAIENARGTRKNADGPQVEEWVSHEPMKLFAKTAQSLNLPVKETPQVPWDAPEKWTDVTKFGPPKPIELVRKTDGKRTSALDWSGPLQKAIDSGATTLFFPNRKADANEPIVASEPPQLGKREKNARQPGEAKMLDPGYGIYGPVHLRGAVRRIIGCEADFAKMVSSNEVRTDFQDELRPVFILDDGDAPAVVVERFSSWFFPIRFEQKSKRALVVSSLSFYDLETQPGSGDVFLEDVRGKQVIVRSSKLWGRQVNLEGGEEPRLLCDGGDVWILGYKTENDATAGIVKNGGRMEIAGGFNYANKNRISPKTLFVNDNSSLSLTTGESLTKNGHVFDVLVREMQNGETRELKNADAPRRGPGAMVPLFSGRTQPSSH